MFPLNAKVDHPLLETIVSTLWTSIVTYLKDKSKTSQKTVVILLKLYITVEYLVFYFFTYNFLGKFIIMVSCIICFNSGSNDSLLLTAFFFGTLVLYVSIIITFYIKMQIPIFRSALIEILGVSVFNYYVGKNPATIGTLRAATVLASCMGVGFACKAGGSYVDATVKQKIMSTYIGGCLEAGIKPDAKVIAEIATSAQTSAMQFLLGETAKNPIYSKKIPFWNSIMNHDLD